MIVLVDLGVDVESRVWLVWRGLAAAILDTIWFGYGERGVVLRKVSPGVVDLIVPSAVANFQHADWNSGNRRLGIADADSGLADSLSITI